MLLGIKEDESERLNFVQPSGCGPEALVLLLEGGEGAGTMGSVTGRARKLEGIVRGKMGNTHLWPLKEDGEKEDGGDCNRNERDFV